MGYFKFSYNILFYLFLIFLIGCASGSQQSQLHKNLRKVIKSDSLTPLIIEAGIFELIVLSNYNVLKENTFDKSTAHIYLEGDGKPYISASKINENPTSKRNLALRLMSHDDKLSFYLSRPCYGWEKIPSYCDTKYWTSARYSKVVVLALNDILDNLKEQFNLKNISIIGHSGGGTLAYLIAATRNDISAVLTIDPNLNHLRWADHYGFPKLTDSLEATNYLPLDSTVKVINLLGEKDKTIEKKLLLESTFQQKNVINLFYPNFTHHCCWERIWPQILEGVGFN